MSSTSKVQLASPVQNGQVKCYHHPENGALKRLISHSSTNPDRAFYSCRVLDAGGKECKFFKWEDELSLTPPSLQGPPAASQSTPTNSLKRPAPSADHELSPTQKRPNAPQQPPAASPRNPASQARLDAIRRAQGLSVGESTSGPPPSPSPPSSRNVDVPNPSQSLPSWSVPSSTSTSTYRPLTPPPTVERAERRWPPQTPPSRGARAQSEHASRTNRNEKGNEEHNGLGTSLNLDALLDVDPFSSPSGRDTGSGGSEPRGATSVAPPHLLPSADPDESSAADDVMNFANRTSAFIRKLQRRLSAAEKSNDAKARKMELMQEEIDQLKARISELELELELA
ncbi:hypothetical protein FB451DRAFT_1211684 [Mycena latifolia]|nr:hypothetical protein FB451DRAFT_1211684 [Mycena latifolia]